MSYIGMGTYICPACGSMYIEGDDLCTECQHKHISAKAREQAYFDHWLNCRASEYLRKLRVGLIKPYPVHSILDDIFGEA